MSADVSINLEAANLDPLFVAKPVQVEETDVVFLPKKDFEATINKDKYYFNKEVPQKIPRSVANMLLEDPDRGYIRT